MIVLVFDAVEMMGMHHGLSRAPLSVQLSGYLQGTNSYSGHFKTRKGQSGYSKIYLYFFQFIIYLNNSVKIDFIAH